jgi:hypothetical protein
MSKRQFHSETELDFVHSLGIAKEHRSQATRDGHPARHPTPRSRKAVQPICFPADQAGKNRRPRHQRTRAGSRGQAPAPRPPSPWLPGPTEGNTRREHRQRRQPTAPTHGSRQAPDRQQRQRVSEPLPKKEETQKESVQTRCFCCRPIFRHQIEVQTRSNSQKRGPDVGFGSRGSGF